MTHQNEFDLIRMQKLASDLEKKYTLPEGTFVVIDAGELHVYFHLAFWGYNSFELNYTYMRSSYTADKVSNTLIVTTQYWDQRSIENHILASVYWEYFAHLLGLEHVRLAPEIKNCETFSLSSLTSTLDHLGYASSANHTKEVNLKRLDILMAGKSDLTQILIDHFLSDFKVSYNIAGFNHDIHCRFYYAGRSYSISFRILGGQYHVYCRNLDMSGQILDGSIHEFMSDLLPTIEKANRLKNLFSPPKFHFQQLTKYSMGDGIADAIYNYFIQKHTAEDIEMACAHKSFDDVFNHQGNHLFISLFDQTYDIDLTTKVITLH